MADAVVKAVNEWILDEWPLTEHSFASYRESGPPASPLTDWVCGRFVSLFPVTCGATSGTNDPHEPQRPRPLRSSA